MRRCPWGPCGGEAEGAGEVGGGDWAEGPHAGHEVTGRESGGQAESRGLGAQAGLFPRAPKAGGWELTLGSGEGRTEKRKVLWTVSPPVGFVLMRLLLPQQ